MATNRVAESGARCFLFTASFPNAAIFQIDSVADKCDLGHASGLIMLRVTTVRKWEIALLGR